MPTFVLFEAGKPAPVDGVERVRGANVKALTAAVEALGNKARLAVGEEEVKA